MNEQLDNTVAMSTMVHHGQMKLHSCTLGCTIWTKTIFNDLKKLGGLTAETLLTAVELTETLPLLSDSEFVLMALLAFGVLILVGD